MIDHIITSSDEIWAIMSNLLVVHPARFQEPKSKGKREGVKGTRKYVYGPRIIGYRPSDREYNGNEI